MHTGQGRTLSQCTRVRAPGPQEPPRPAYARRVWRHPHTGAGPRIGEPERTSGCLKQLTSWPSWRPSWPSSRKPRSSPRRPRFHRLHRRRLHGLLRENRALRLGAHGLHRFIAAAFMAFFAKTVPFASAPTVFIAFMAAAFMAFFAKTVPFASAPTVF